jgi:hypothetical protein
MLYWRIKILTMASKLGVFPFLFGMGSSLVTGGISGKPRLGYL